MVQGTLDQGTGDSQGTGDVLVYIQESLDLFSGTLRPLQSIKKESKKNFKKDLKFTFKIKFS